MRLSRAMIASVAVLGLGACSIAIPSSAPATFDLQTPEVTRSQTARKVQLTINPPSAVRTVDTEEVLVKGADGRVSYVSGVAWGDRLPRLFQARLVETFANSGHFKAVLTNQDRVTGDMSLSVEIRAFEVQASGSGFEAVVDVYAKLIDERSGRVAMTQSFQERVKTSRRDVMAGIPALNEAFQKVALDILAWVSARKSV